MPKPENRKRWYNTQTKAKTCHQSEKDGTILKKCKNLSAVRKRWYNTQTELKPSPVRKRCKILKQGQNLSRVKKRWCNSETEQMCHHLEIDGTILKQGQNLSPVRKDGTILKRSQTLSPVRKRWYNTQTVPKPANSQKKIVQYSIRARTCHQSEKDGTMLKQGQNL